MESSVYPTRETMARTNSVSNSIKRTLQVACHHLSQLHGRSIEEYCAQENVQRFIINIFTTDEKANLNSQPLEQWNIKLLYKLLRYACGLAPREDSVWKIKADTLEFLIYFVYSEVKTTINEAASYHDQHLNKRLDNLVEFLVRILAIVECQKDVDLRGVKEEVQKDIRKKTDSLSRPASYYNRTSLSSLSDQNYMSRILVQAVIHRLFVMTFRQLNCLKSESVSSYLRKHCRYQNPMRLFTREEERLLEEGNIRPVNMPVHLVYKLLQKVCGLLNHSEWAMTPNTLEHSLHCLYQEYARVVLMDNESQKECLLNMCHHLETMMKKIAEKTGKSQRELIKEMPKEPQSLDKSFERLPSITSKYCSEVTSPQSLQHQPQGIPLSHQPSLPSLSGCDPEATNPLRPEEINIASLYKVLCPGGTAARILCVIFSALSGNINNIEPAHKKKSFTSKELEQMTGDLKDVDITFMFKLLRFACRLSSLGDPVWITPGDTLEYTLTSIKNARNEFVHETAALTNQELEEKLANMERLLETALVKTSTREKVDLQENIEEMKQEIKTLAMSFDPNNYIQCVKDLREKLSSKIVVDAKKELRQYYEKTNTNNSSPVTWVFHTQHEKITIDKIFVDLEIVGGNDGTTQTYSLTDLLEQHEEQQTISRATVVQGVAGVGKTSLCKYIVHLYSSDESHSCMKDVDMLIYIQCRYVKSSSLLSYLRSTLPETFKGIDKDDIIPLLQDPRVMLLVDGYDEALSEAKKLLEDALHSLPDSRIIITCKPQWVPKLTSKIYQVTSSCKVVKIVGFSKKAHSTFIRNFFQVMVGSSSQQLLLCNNFMEYLHEREDQLCGLTQLPLTLALLALLWIEDSTKAKETRTVAQLYKKLTDFIMKRLGSNEDVDDQDPYHKWVLLLSQVAWQNLIKNQHHLSDNDVMKLKRKGEYLDVSSTKIFSYLLHCETHTSLTDCSEVWTFKHNCQQEYFAAEYITDVMINSEKPLNEILGFYGNDDEDKKLQRLIPVIEFISDLLHHNEEMTEARATEIAKVTLSVKAPWSFIAVRQMFQHLLLDNQGMIEIFKNMFAGEQMAEFLDEYDPQSVQWILENTSLALPAYINLKNCIGTVLKMEPLLKLLADRSIKVEVAVIVDNAANISRVVKFIEKIHDESVKFVMMTWHPNSLAGLMRNWPWPRKLYLNIPREIFPLFWWELEVSLIAASMSRITIYHNHTETAMFNVMKKRAESLGVNFFHDSDLPLSQLCISAIWDHTLPPGM